MSPEQISEQEPRPLPEVLSRQERLAGAINREGARYEKYKRLEHSGRMIDGAKRELLQAFTTGSVSDRKEAARSHIKDLKLVGDDLVQEYLPELKQHAIEEMEKADVPYDDGSHPHQKIDPRNLPKTEKK